MSQPLNCITLWIYGATDQTWTGMILLSMDFKSIASADFATVANYKIVNDEDFHFIWNTTFIL